VIEFGSLNHSPGKRVLNNLKTICLRFRKVVVQRVAVIKFRVNNRCDNGTGSFEVKIWADTTKFTNVIITINQSIKFIISVAHCRLDFTKKQ